MNVAPLLALASLALAAVPVRATTIRECGDDERQGSNAVARIVDQGSTSRCGSRDDMRLGRSSLENAVQLPAYTSQSAAPATFGALALHDYAWRHEGRVIAHGHGSGIEGGYREHEHEHEHDLDDDWHDRGEDHHWHHKPPAAVPLPASGGLTMAGIAALALAIAAL